MKHLLFAGILLLCTVACLNDSTEQQPETLAEHITIARLEGQQAKLLLPESRMNQAMEVYLGEGTQVAHTAVRYAKEGKVYYLFIQGEKAGRQQSIGIPLLQSGTYFYLPYQATIVHACVASETNTAAGTCDIVRLVVGKALGCKHSGQGDCDSEVKFDDQAPDMARIEQFKQFFAAQTS